MGRTVKARIELLEATARQTGGTADLLARKREQWDGPEGDARRERFERYYADFWAVTFRPEYDTPADEIRRNVDAHVRQQVEACRAVGRRVEPSATDAMVEALYERARALSVEEWADCMICAGYANAWPDRIERARAGTRKAPAGATP